MQANEFVIHFLTSETETMFSDVSKCYTSKMAFCPQMAKRCKSIFMKNGLTLFCHLRAALLNIGASACSIYAPLATYELF